MPNSTPDPSTPDSLAFAAYHQPTLTSGDYEITITHTLQTQNVQNHDRAYIASQAFITTRRFRVEGERFQLKPEAIQAVFPPEGSLGDHSNVFPHIILNRSTLPWERSPTVNNAQDRTNEPLPWLLLLVFNESEKPETKVITLGELVTSTTDTPKTIFPEIALSDLQKAHQKESDPISVIDVPRKVLEPLLSAKNELSILAHVRCINLSGNPTPTDLNDNEQAVIIANRLPQPGATSTVHLVSIEGRYVTGGEFDFQNAEPNDLIRLVSLTSWRFSCIASEQTFANMIKGLERDHQSFRLPNSSNPDAEKFLQDSFVPVRHILRQGGKTLSWYRGPFATGIVNDIIQLPVKTSDELLRYHSDVGMFDVSYASAWELGRLIALQSPTFSTSLYEWKRLRNQQHKRDQRSEQKDHPLETLSVTTEMPEFVRDWLEKLSHLQGVPFKYLVPDEKLLPTESIRFCQVDLNWIRCLLDGAYSIGRITTHDFECDSQLTNTFFTPNYQMTAVLIRSNIVSGYPGLLIDAYKDRNSALTELRREYLSQSILLYLFEGELDRLNIHQKPEALHLALELESNGYQKKFTEQSPPFIPVKWKEEERRIVDILKLAEDICKKIGFPCGEFKSGHFAQQMIKIDEGVSFNCSPEEQT